MANRRVSNPDMEPSRQPPAKTPDERENQLVAAAVDLAEKQLLDGSASAQVITHYLKLGSSRERLEQTRLEYENRLTEQKIQSMASQQSMEEKYVAALRAFSSYKGIEDPDQYVEGDYVEEV